MTPHALRPLVVDVNGMSFDALEAGEGPLVLCLHGFPDQARSFSDLLRQLAREGYRAIAPTLRGYAPENRAPDGCYQDWATGGDVLALIEALGHERAIVIGHDWGASAAYAAAALAPDRVERLVTLAVPYGPALARSILTDGDQQRRSWYWYFFQLPFAEDAVAHDDFAFIDRLWAEWSPGYRLPEAERAALKQMLAKPGVLTQVLAYYRQMFARPDLSPDEAAKAKRIGQPISVPTLYLHGADDGCIGAGLGEESREWFTGDYRRVVVEAAGHFLHLEQPGIVGDEIVRFLSEPVRQA